MQELTGVQVLVEKAESDDALIEAMQQEIQSARSQLEESKRKLREQMELNQPQMRTMRAADGGMTSAVDTSTQALEAELSRLRRLCKQQVTVYSQDRIVPFYGDELYSVLAGCSAGDPGDSHPEVEGVCCQSIESLRLYLSVS